MQNATKKIELLAPAGNMRSLHAAVCGGADAVYLGLEHFNARRGADNFTFNNLNEAIDYAHLRGVKVFLTFNIAVFEGEMQRAVKYASQAAQAGIDAFIVQDIGVLLSLKKHVCGQFPNVGLHASTQMNIHNVDGLVHVARMGVSRVTLARELSLQEISNICSAANDLGVDIEVFGHGAICVCYSGQCLMSSMIGGRSANRGTCAQACRLNYQLQTGSWQSVRRASEDDRRGAYLLSPKDLCSVDLLQDLRQSGIASLKLEGRMKSPEYVNSVCMNYRAAIDSLYEENDQFDTSEFNAEQAKSNLSKVFSRGFSAAYLQGLRGNSIMSYQRPNNRGISIGRVEYCSKNKISLDTKQQIREGDVLEVWTAKGRANIVIDSRWNLSKKRAEAKIDMTQKPLFYVRRGDRVFLVRSADMAFNDSPLDPRVQVSGLVQLKIGMPLSIRVWSCDRPHLPVEVIGDVVESARTRAVTDDEVREHVMRCGTTPFVFSTLDVDLGNNVGIGFSALHRLRADALCQLEQLLLEDVSMMRSKSREVKDA